MQILMALHRHVIINCADRVAKKNAKKKESLLNCLEPKLARLSCDFHQKPVGMEIGFDIHNWNFIKMHSCMQRIYSTIKSN